MKTFKLIDGIFDNEESKDLILTLLDDKINFQKCKNLSLKVKKGSLAPHVTDRIEKLRKVRKELVAFFEEHKNSTDFTINSIVEIKEKASVPQSN